jgi:hypothetical protein
MYTSPTQQLNAAMRMISIRMHGRHAMKEFSQHNITKNCSQETPLVPVRRVKAP